MSDYQEYKVKVYNKAGRTEWYQDGKLHRLNGPAVEYALGDKLWFQNDKLHRLDGPAIEWAGGTKSWWQNGKRHRLDGPAVEYANGTKRWFIDNVKYTEKEFNKKINLVKELTVAQIQDMLGFQVKIVKG